jgi:hypothetical protein
MDRKEQLKQLLSNANALLQTMRYSTTTATGDMANIGNFSSYKMFLRKYDALARQAAPLLPDTAMLDLIKLDRISESGDTVWPVQKELFELAYSNTALLKSLLEGAVGYAADESQKFKDFIQANLRKAIFGVPDKELEIQNGIESLLVGRGMEKGTDYDREAGRVKASGKESIPDFTFPSLNLCLEVKLSKSSDRLRAIVDEINADIRAYSTKYDRQFYVVYDVGVIRDETEFKQGLEDAPGVSVLIVKH